MDTSCARFWSSLCLWLGWSLSACAIPTGTLAVQHGALSESALFITEVAQQTAYGGSSADKVELYCPAADGCAAFRVCDANGAGTGSCSALQPALAVGARSVVSRGVGVTNSDEVWLADALGIETPDTRVGPFDCPGGQSRARSDCVSASFGACGIPSLGSSSGSCSSDSSFRYRAGFTRNQHGQPETTCTRPLCEQLLSSIGAALQSIDFAVYGVRGQPAIIAALVAAEARGVRVRGVVDTENSDCTKFGYPDSASLISRVGPSQVVCDVGPGYSAIMHNKFFVFDRAQVWTGSTNLSDTELGGEYNSDVAVLITSPALAAIYTTEFEEMFGGAFHHRKTNNTPHELADFGDGTIVKSYFSPSDDATDNAIIPLIDNAAATLDVAMFFFTDASIAAALIAAHARGVRVRMVLDAGGAANKYSQHTQLCAAGIEVKVENWGGKSHSKWVVADAGQAGASVLFGSMNWTGAGNKDNDENTLLVQNAALAQQFSAEFARQWSDLARVPSCRLVAAESAASSQCSPANDCSRQCSSGACCDGLDNDYDGRVDLQEEACACADGIDNDGDGYIDGADFDCQVARADPD